MNRAVVEVKMSESFQAFLAATLDLLDEIERTDRVLLTDAVAEAAEKLERVVDKWRGDL